MSRCTKDAGAFEQILTELFRSSQDRAADARFSIFEASSNTIIGTCRLVPSVEQCLILRRRRHRPCGLFRHRAGQRYFVDARVGHKGHAPTSPMPCPTNVVTDRRAAHASDPDISATFSDHTAASSRGRVEDDRIANRPARCAFQQADFASGIGSRADADTDPQRCRRRGIGPSLRPAGYARPSAMPGQARRNGSSAVAHLVASATEVS